MDNNVIELTLNSPRYKDFTVPQELLERWRAVIDSLVEICGVSSGFINQVHGPNEPKITILIKNTDDPNGDKVPVGLSMILNGSDVYCEETVKTDTTYKVEDALNDPRWANSPELDLGYYSYIGVPILYPNGSVFGTICILDTQSRTFSESVEKVLHSYRDHICADIELQLKISELEKTNQQLTELTGKLELSSFIDPLTNTYNRRFLSKHIDNHIQRVDLRAGRRQSETPDIGFLLVDIDHFKRVNDLHGHSAGDCVLKQVVDCIKKNCRESDWLIRWGGEEFLIVGQFSKMDHLHHFAERIRSQVAEQNFTVKAGLEIKITCSIGMTMYPFDSQSPQGLNWEQVVNLADFALYYSKHLGRDSWTHFKSSNVVPLKQAYQECCDDIESALANGNIEVITNGGS
ncbi:sensor domain-containing diguanylate cyclase [Vibrio sp. S4M6]|uniref:sensor domain-containing diguanylate cyclase n=1 Tax=Vibrio sinus TaxID=2946865 RepID=UPI00202A56AE|nr:sensor domain-containing diguanylate cyclase [Vibrio sinus]MCL9783972.1 sensor domain-containing diguanylate cyclase [Vibrio sinus]